MDQNRLSAKVAGLVVLSSLVAVLFVEEPYNVHAAGEPVSITFDTALMDNLYIQGVRAHQDGDYVGAMVALYTLQLLYFRSRIAPNPIFEDQLAADIQSARFVLSDGLKARNELPFVRQNLEACAARPQCQGGAGGLQPDLTPPRPSTNLPPAPPRFR